jgi:vitamin B12 transporter
MSRTRSGLLLTISAAALAVAAHGARAQEATAVVPVTAQTTAVNELPPVVVEGATIEAKPVVKAKAKAQPQPVAVEDEPAPEPVKAAKKIKKAAVPEAPPKVKAKAVAKAAPASAPQDAPPVDAVDTSVNAGDTAAAGTSETSGGVSAEKLGTPVSVVTGEQLRQRQARTAGEALRNLPGVAVSRTGGEGGITQVRIRGAEGNHTLVLIDGIEANDTTNGEFYFSDLATENIDSIEVLRGPQSGLYGSGAIGGVVNIITTGGRGPLTIKTMGEAGSFNSYAGSVGISGGTDKAWAAINLTERRTDGFNISPTGSENDGSQLKSFSARGGVQVVPGVTVDLTLRHTKKFGDRDDQIFVPPFFTSDGLQHDTSSTFKDTAWFGAARLTWESLDGHLVQVAKATRNETKRTDLEYDAVNTINTGLREDYNYAATYRLDTPALLAAHHYFTGYAEHENESFTPNSDFGFGTVADGITRSRSLNAEAFEYRGEFADRLFVQGTVRHDESSVFGGFNTWRTAASLRLPEIGLRPHASYGTGLKLPTMFENFGTIPGSYFANPDLGPERSKGWDAGAEVTLVPGHAVVDVTYFNDELTNKIRSFAKCRALPPLFKFECTAVNDPGVSPRQGVEVDSRFNLGSGVSAGLAYTYTDARTAKGVQEIRRPKHAGRGDISYVFDAGRASVNLSAQYIRGNLDTNFGTFETVEANPYWLVNIAAAYKVQPGVEVYGRVENLLDTYYQEIYGFQTAGIAAYAGVRFTYEEPSTKDWVKYK